MASLKHIRTRIRAVKSTQKITRAMKMVAAAKLRRAQEDIQRMRPYAWRLRDVIRDVSARTDASRHPLLAVREPRRVLLLVFTSDRGLCGSFNANINRTAQQWLNEHQGEFEHVALAVVGRKGRDYFARRGYTIDHYYEDVLTDPTIERIQQVGEDMLVAFQDESLDAIYLVYNEFKNALIQRPVVERVLPVEPSGDSEEAPTPNGSVDFLYEPDPRTILDAVLPLYFNYQLYRALLESVASEMGARMTAMESATKNATELIDRLTLEFNRARQAAITKEILEIVGGAEALRQA